MFRSLLVLLAIPALGANFDVRERGAKGDGIAKDTAALQRALDSAAAAGGGTVTVPAGKYLSGTIHLRSNTTLHLDPGAVILASPDNNDFDSYETLPFETVSDKETTYFHYALLAAEGVHDVAITGEGAVDGNRTKRGGPKTIAIKVSQNVAIRGITVRNSPNYSISFWGCDFVIVDGVHIVNGYADGIDPDASRNVRISNSYIDVYDDAICPKASPSMGMANRRAVENLTVTNCVLRTNCSNFKFGTESSGDFKNVAVTNCVMLPRDTGRPPVSGISLESVDGAHIQGVVISNITMQGVRVPIFLRLANRGRGVASKIPGALEDISISNVSARGASLPSSITGIPGARIRRVSLDGIRLTHTGGVKDAPPLDVDELVEKYPEGTMWDVLPAWAFYTRHADAITLRGIDAAWDEPDARPAMVFDDVADLVLDGFNARSAAGSGPVLWFRDVAGAMIRGCRTVAAPLFLATEGKTRGIVLTGNDLGAARRVQR
jgi:hypothetical protein